jgi:uncharacterized protein
MKQDAGTLFGRGVAFPPRLSTDGRWSWSEGAQNVREAMEIILLTELRERVMLPEFGAGLQTFLFEPNTVTTHQLLEERARQALTRWEPRIRLERVTAKEDPSDPQSAILTVVYRLVATAQPDQLELSIQLNG